MGSYYLLYTPPVILGFLTVNHVLEKVGHWMNKNLLYFPLTSYKTSDKKLSVTPHKNQATTFFLEKHLCRFWQNFCICCSPWTLLSTLWSMPGWAGTSTLHSGSFSILKCPQLQQAEVSKIWLHRRVQEVQARTTHTCRLCQDSHSLQVCLLWSPSVLLCEEHQKWSSEQSTPRMGLISEFCYHDRAGKDTSEQ